MKVEKTFNHKYEIVNFAGFFKVYVDGNDARILRSSYRAAEEEVMRKALGISVND